MSTITIRPATPADASVVAEIACKCWAPIYEGYADILGEELYRTVAPEPLLAKVEAVQAAIAEGRSFVAESDGILCGFSGFIVDGIIGKYTGFHTAVLTDVGAADACFSVDISKLYEAMLNEVCSALEGKEKKLAPMEQLLIPIKAALACKVSKLAGGKEMTLDDGCIADRTVLFEEPFAPENETFIGDMGIPFAADESAHSLKDVNRRIQLGYKALTLKPIAKTVTVTMRMAAAAHEANVSCFCADLTVNPLMVQRNKNFAARLPLLPGMKIGIIESNGAQNYVRWEEMKGYVPGADTQGDGPIYTLDDAFYRKAGGLYETPEHYLQLLYRKNPQFMR